MTNFALTATSLLEIWTPAWRFACTSRFHKIIFLIFSTEWYSFFLFGPIFFSFFYQGLSLVFDFSMSNGLLIRKELPRVRFVHGLNKVRK